MGLCETKKKENEPKIDIIKDNKKEKDINKEIERVIPGNANYFNTDQFENISKQKDKSICKIIKTIKIILFNII